MNRVNLVGNSVNNSETSREILSASRSVHKLSYECNDLLVQYKVLITVETLQQCVANNSASVCIFLGKYSMSYRREN